MGHLPSTTPNLEYQSSWNIFWQSFSEFRKDSKKYIYQETFITSQSPTFRPCPAILHNGALRKTSTVKALGCCPAGKVKVSLARQGPWQWWSWAWLELYGGSMGRFTGQSVEETVCSKWIQHCCETVVVAVKGWLRLNSAITLVEYRHTQIRPS